MIQFSPPPPRVALIGLDGYAFVYVDWLLQAHESGTVEIVAVTAPPEEHSLPRAKKLQATSARFYGNYQSMLEAEKGTIDICFIPTGIQWHSRMAIAAMEAGCNVLVEKPLAGSVADGMKIAEAARRAGRWVAVGFQDMYTDEVLDLKRRLLKKEIGKIKSISMLGIWPRPRHYYQRNNWAGRIVANDEFVLDSPLNNALAHFVNLSLFFAGESLHESSDAFLNRAQLYRSHDIENFDTAVIQATSPTGIEFWFGASHASSTTIEPTIRIKGSKGQVEWLQDHRYTIVSSKKGKKTYPLRDSFAARHKMFDTVIGRLQDPDARICEPETALCHTRLIESIQRFGMVVDFDPGLIEETPFEGTDSKVPSVSGLDRRLQEAFDTATALNDQDLASVASKP